MKWWKSTILATLALASGAVAATATVTWQAEPDRGGPKKTIAYGARGNCVSKDEISAFALVPDGTIALAKNDRPVLFAYLPDVESKEALLVVRHLESGREVLRLKFEPPAGPAIAALRLPEGLSLVAGETYRWSIVLACDNAAEEEAFADMQPTIVPSSPPYRPVERRAQWFADRQLWHNTLETLAREWENNPQLWQAFLSSWEWKTPQDASQNFLEELSALPEVPTIFVELRNEERSTFKKAVSG